MEQTILDKASILLVSVFSRKNEYPQNYEMTF